MPQMTTYIKPDPAPFDVDSYLNDYLSGKPIEDGAKHRENFAKALFPMVKPYIAGGYNFIAATNRAFASLAAHLDAVTDYVSISTGMQKEGLFEDIANHFNQNADYWRGRAEKVGISFLVEMISEALGQSVFGAVQFALDVESGFTLPYMAGASKAYKRGDSPFAAGITEAAKTATLDALFKVMVPLKKYLKAPAFSTVFGLQEAAGAPEGKKAAAFAKGAGIGAIYAAGSPGGYLGLNEVKKASKSALEAIRPYINNETGQVTAWHGSPYEFEKFSKEKIGTGEGAQAFGIEDSPVKRAAMAALEKLKEERGSFSTKPTRQRKFLKTIQEAKEIDPTLREKAAEIKPQDYFVQPNAESFGAADEVIRKQGLSSALEYARDEKNNMGNRGATYQKLIDTYQKAGDFEKATEIVEEVDRTMRSYGQFIQAAAFWSKKASPQTFIHWANKQLDKVKSKYGWTDTILNKKPESFTLSKEEQKLIFEKYREIDKLTNEADRADATLELIDMVAKKVPPSVSEMIDAYRYSNMLSGITTQERNAFWNLESTFLTRPFDMATRAGIDWVQSGLTGKAREAYLRDVPVYYKAAVNAIPNGARAFMDSMRLVKSAGTTKPEIGIEMGTEFERARTAQLPKALTVVPRFMDGTDKFMQAMISAGEMTRLMKNGVPETDAYARSVELAEEYLLRNKFEPNDPRLSLPSKALNSLGYGMDYMRKLPVIGKVSSWYIPFLKTPVNVGIQMIEHSPMGAVRGKWTQEAGAKVLSGSIVTAVGALMAYNGNTTWSPPSDPDKKELFYAAKKVPYSYQFGDTYIPVWYFGPFALAMAMPAAAKYYFDENPKSASQSAIKNFTDMLGGYSEFIGRQSSTQSIGAFFSVLNGDIDYSFFSQSAFTVQQLIPASSLIRFTNTIIDRTYRHPKTFTERIEANLPILSKNLEAYTDPYGKISKRTTVNYFLPYNVGAQGPREKMFESQLRIQNKLDKTTEKIRGKTIQLQQGMHEYFNLMKKQTE